MRGQVTTTSRAFYVRLKNEMYLVASVCLKGLALEDTKRSSPVEHEYNQQTGKTRPTHGWRGESRLILISVSRILRTGLSVTGPTLLDTLQVAPRSTTLTNVRKPPAPVFENELVPRLSPSSALRHASSSGDTDISIFNSSAASRPVVTHGAWWSTRQTAAVKTALVAESCLAPTVGPSRRYRF